MRKFFLVFLLLLAMASSASAENVIVKWDENSDAEYYVVYWGNTSLNYQHSESTTKTWLEINDFDVSGEYFLSVKAFNPCGNSSDFSDEISKNIFINVRTVADVNGDGRDDIVHFTSSGVKVAFSNGSSFNEPQLMTTGLGSGWTPRFPRMSVDINGDGKADFVGLGNSGIWVSISAGTSVPLPVKWTSEFSVASGWDWTKNRIFFKDVNNDGRADAIGFGNSGVWVAINTGSSFSPMVKWTAGFAISAGWDWTIHRVFVEDINSDGTADLFCFGPSGTWVSTSTGSVFTDPVKVTSSFATNSGWNWLDHRLLIGDFHEDGFPDIGGCGPSGVSVSVNSGTSIGSSTRWTNDFSINSGWDWTVHRVFMADVNNDGRSDIVAFGPSGVWVGLSIDTGFATMTKWIEDFSINGGWDWLDNNEVFIGYANADNLPDIIAFGNSATWVSINNGSGFNAKTKWSGYAYK